MDFHFTPAAGWSAGLVALNVAAFFFAFRAIRSARTPQGAVGWAFFLMVLPWLGVPAFLVFGDFRYPNMVSARRSSQSASRAGIEGFEERKPASGDEGDPLRAGFETLAERRAVAGNAAELLIDHAAIDAIFAGVAAARQYILIETYILRDDRTGRLLRERLIAKAREGVRVHVLYDPFGSHGLDRAYLKLLRAAGVTITNFHARHKSRLFAPMRLNFRDHRKIAVIDGETGFTGGFNFGDEYLGRNPRLGPWRDTLVRLTGPAVAQLQAHFAEDWHWATGKSLDLNWRPEAAPSNVTGARARLGAGGRAGNRLPLLPSCADLREKKNSGSARPISPPTRA